MTTELLVRIQHHPSRAGLLDRLVPGLAGLPVEVMEHQSVPPNPWEGYRACLDALPADCEHLLVIQDDATPCRNLPLAVEQIRRAKPDDPVCLFVGRQGVRTKRWYEQALASRAMYSLIHPRDFLPVVAVLWPRPTVEDILDWWENGAKQSRSRPPRSDDGQLGIWMKDRKRDVYATVPSLVEHPDDVESTIKKRRNQRCALHFIGERDPLEIEW